MNRLNTMLALTCVLASSLIGCGSGSLSYTVSRSSLREMSRQGQVAVYDAENEIVVALDQLDEARDKLAAIRRRIKRAEKAVDAAGKRKGGASLAEAWVEVLEELEDWGRDNIRLEKLRVTMAKASFELAKARVIQQEDLLGGKDFNVKDFQAQFNQLKKRFVKRFKKLRKLRAKVRKLEARWWKKRRDFVARTGDHDSGIWIE